MSSVRRTDEPSTQRLSTTPTTLLVLLDEVFEMPRRLGGLSEKSMA